MTASRDEVVRFTDGLLKPGDFRDACPNGLQVFGEEEIRRVATCTSVSEAFFLKALDAQANLLLVHHGLFWDGASRVVDPLMARRLRVLLDAGMNLMAYHLPLDAHPRVGNNARLADRIGLEELDFNFGHYKGMAIGCCGNLPGPRSLGDLADQFREILDAQPVQIDMGKPVSRVGVVSGGAGDVSFLLEAREHGCDTFVTGVVFEQSVAIAREAGLNVLAIGHYNSERLGVQALGDTLAEQFAVDVTHVDVPNPL